MNNPSPRTDPRRRRRSLAVCLATTLLATGCAPGQVGDPAAIAPELSALERRLSAGDLSACLDYLQLCELASSLCLGAATAQRDTCSAIKTRCDTNLATYCPGVGDDGATPSPDSATPSPDSATPSPDAGPAPAPDSQPVKNGELTIVKPLTLSSAQLSAGDTLSGTVTYKNKGSVSVTVQRMVIALRPPGGSKAGGPYADMQPFLQNQTVAPGATITVSASRSFSSSDPGGQWFGYSTYQDAAGAWHDSGPVVYFSFGQSTSSADAGAPQPDSGTTLPPPPPPPPSTGDISGLHVSGNRIVNGNGQEVRLRGVNRSGPEYACIQGWGIFDGPSDEASIKAIKSWKTNAVRIPLNETCWLAINGAPSQYSGSNYRNAIINYVNLLVKNGLVPIVELHWAAAGSQKATTQSPMPNRDHSVEFWRQVATTFKNNSSVVFELYNEPWPDNNQDTAEAWRCWRDGGTCRGINYQAAGMQELVNAIRATGAKNVVLLGGIQWSNTLSGWLSHEPQDPTNNLGAAWHVYNFNWCTNTSCYNVNPAAVSQAVPLVTTEIGQDDCKGDFIKPLMSWLDNHNAGYLGWTWDTWGGCIVLISDYAGTPKGAYGQTFHDHLATVVP